MSNPATKAIAANDKLVAGLEHPGELEAITAKALLGAAQSRAMSRPTPQAPKVAVGFSVVESAIRGPQAGDLAAITMGAEFGSTQYRQFGGRQSRGSWLFPTIASPPAGVEQAQSAFLESLTR